VLFIHVGTHKTGTSAVQRFFMSNRDALRSRGVHYVETGLREADFAHYDLARSVAQGPSSDLWTKLRAEVGAGRDMTHVISCEAFWKEDPRSVRQCCAGIGPIKVLAYLRRQDNFFESLYKHHIKLGGSMSFDEFFSKRKKAGDYLAVLEKWEHSFGNDHLVVKHYDTPSGSINIVEDMLRTLGMTADPSLVRPPRTNSSPRAELLPILRALHKLDDSSAKGLFEKLRRRSLEYARTGDFLTYSQRITILEDFADSNREVSARYTGSPFPPLTDSPRDIWPVDSEEHYRLLLDVFDLAGRLRSRRVRTRKRRVRAGAPQLS
jgi:hypothetical protein